MKKVLRYLCVLLLALVCFSSFGSEKVSAACSHKWNSGTITKSATCTATGVRTYKCTKCSATKTETIAKKAHTMGWVTVVQPTCSSYGRRDYRCTVCGGATQNSASIDKIPHTWNSGSVTKSATCTATGVRTYKCTKCSTTKTETIAALGHKYSWVTTKQPTCGASGLSEYKCSRCGHVSNGQTIPYTGKHTWKVTSTTAATCTADGKKTSKCTVCGQTKTETNGTKLGHNYVASVTKQPTCTATGVRTYKCSRCTASYTESIAALGHSYSWVTTKQPTCGATGLSEYKCSRCGHVSNGQTIPYTGKHTWKVTSTTAATCTADGKKTSKCTVCGQTKTETNGTKLGHNYVASVTKQPTCTATGVRTYKCSRCTASYTESIAALGHSYSWVTTKQPTCGVAGLSEYKCSRCGHVSNGQTIPYTGKHTWNSGVVTKAATCTAAGVKTYTCSVCKGTKTETIAAPGHSYSWVTTKQPTCGVAGLSEYKCSRCGHVSNGQTIPYTGKHTWKVTSTTSATCTADGSIKSTCTVCGQTKTEVNGTKLGHNYVASVTKQPTCTTTGVKTYKCSRCTASYTETIAKIAHTMGWVTVVEPTCTKAGRRDYRCTVCEGATQDSKSIDIIPHSYDAGKVTTEPTCGKAGVKTYTCRVCGKTKTETISATGKHIMPAEPTVTNPTCYANGKKEWICTVCGKAIQGETIQSLPHNMGVRNVVDSTCNKEGSKEFYCKNSGCTYSYKEVIKKKDHVYELYDIIEEATCQKEGDYYYSCTNPGCTDGYHKTIPRKEHDLDSEMPSHNSENPFMQSHADACHLRHCSSCNKGIEQPHTAVLYHLEGTDTDAYFCIDDNNNPCGCCSLAKDCQYINRMVYHRLLPLKNGGYEYQQKIVETCKNCGTVRTRVYAVKATKPTDNSISASGVTKTLFNSIKNMVIDDVKGLIGDKFVLFTVADNLYTLASDLYDYLSKCGVNGDSLPFHQITDKEQLEMVDLILIANQECAVTYDYTNSRIKIKFPSGEQSANYCYYNFDYLYDFEYTIK